MRAALALGLLLSIPLLPAALAATGPVPMPGYGVGDEWRYTVNVVDQGGVAEEGERRVTVVARGPVDYHGASRQAVTVATYENTTAGGETVSSASTTAYDARTGAFLFTRADGSDTVADEPCVEIDYPVAIGDRWTSTCTIGDVAVETMYQAVGAERLVVHAVPHDTIAIDKIGDLVGRIWIAEDSCGRPVAEFYQVNERATYVNLTSVDCLKGGTAPPPASTPATPPTPSPTPTPGGGGTAPRPQAPPLARPTWDTWDAWRYDRPWTAGGKAYTVRTGMSVTVDGSESDTRGRAHELDYVRRVDHIYEGDDTAGAAAAYEHVWMERKSDGAWVMESTKPYNNSAPFGHGFETYRRYSDPCPMVKWPITPGDQWNIRCAGYEQNRTGKLQPLTWFNLTGFGYAGPVERLAVPAGTFDAYPVTFEWTDDLGNKGGETRYYAKDVCGIVRFSPDPYGRGPPVDLKEFRCQATGLGSLPPPDPDRGSPGAGLALVLGGLAAAALLARRKAS